MPLADIAALLVIVSTSMIGYAIDRVSPFEIQKGQIHTPRLWARDAKDSAKSEIGSNYRIDIALESFDTTCNLIVQLKSTSDQYSIEGNNGAIFLVLPSELGAVEDERRVDYLDESGAPIEGASLPYFKEGISEILKAIAPGIGRFNVAEITEKVFEVIGVGRLEPVHTQGTIFGETEGYQTLFSFWEAIYKKGRWIRAYTLQLSVPLGVDLDTAERLLKET